MAEGNGKIGSPGLDVEHELPAPRAEDESACAPDVAALQAELQRTRQERDALLDRTARMQAEFENARRRSQREQQDYRDFALAGALQSLIPILDSFDRALASAAGAGNLQKIGDFRSGMELIDRQLHDALGKLGVEEISAEGEPFDPSVHEAIELVDSEKVPDHHVLEELQRGYRLKGRLLRPAMVRVARNPHNRS